MAFRENTGWQPVTKHNAYCHWKASDTTSLVTIAATHFFTVTMNRALLDLANLPGGRAQVR
jgi:hypothetical protein